MKRLAAVLILLSSALPVRADITTGLVAWWKLDETSGTSAADSSGNGHDGTYARDASNTTASGRVVRCYDPNGTTDYVWASCNQVNNAASGTIAYWTNRASGSKSAAGCHDGSASNCLKLQWHTTNTVYISVGNAGEQYYGYTSTATGWHHVCGVYDASASPKLKIYVDGSSVTPTSGTGATITSLGSTAGSVAWIGRDPTGTGYCTDPIDDVRVYNRALSASDVAELYAYTGALAYSRSRVVNNGGTVQSQTKAALNNR